MNGGNTQVRQRVNRVYLQKSSLRNPLNIMRQPTGKPTTEQPFGILIAE